MYVKTQTIPKTLAGALKREVQEHDAQHHTLTQVEFSRDTVLWLNAFTMREYRHQFEYAVLFRWEPGAVQPLHIDGVPPGAPRNASLNLLVSGGEEATFEWYKAEVLPEPLDSTSGIKAFNVKQEEAVLINREPLRQFALYRTNLPHRVANITTPTELLCLRLKGNPTFDELTRR
jgi:hypothetical protein